ncbi:MAG: TolC family protein [Cyclobacteriaceae bacterium]|nr:TolC family protein [Cyclobacteriaceae bacterium]
MKLIKTFLLTLLVINAYAQVRISNFHECWEYAKANNAQYAAEQIGLRQASVMKNINRASMLPQIKATGGIEHHFNLPVQLLPAEIFGGEAGTFQEVRFGLPYSANAAIEGSWQLLKAGQWTDISIARLDEQIAEETFRHYEITLKQEVAVAWYSLLQSEENKNIARENLIAADTLLKTALEMDARQMADPIDLNRIRALKNQMEIQYEDAIRLYQNRNDQLMHLLGSDRVEIVSPAYALESADLADWQNTGMTQDPASALAKLRHQKSQLQLRKSRLELLPEISAFASVSRMTFSENINMFSSNQMWFDIGVVGLKIDVPIFTGLRRKNNINWHRLADDQARLEAKYQQSQSQVKDLQLIRDLESSTENMAKAKDNRLASNQNYTLAMYRFEQGYYNIREMIDVYQEKLQSDNLYLDKITRFLIARTQMEIRKADADF